MGCKEVMFVECFFHVLNVKCDETNHKKFDAVCLLCGSHIKPFSIESTKEWYKWKSENLIKHMIRRHHSKKHQLTAVFSSINNLRNTINITNHSE